MPTGTTVWAELGTGAHMNAHTSGGAAPVDAALGTVRASFIVDTGDRCHRAPRTHHPTGLGAAEPPLGRPIAPPGGFSYSFWERLWAKKKSKIPTAVSEIDHHILAFDCHLERCGKEKWDSATLYGR